MVSFNGQSGSQLVCVAVGQGTSGQGTAGQGTAGPEGQGKQGRKPGQEARGGQHLY